MSSWDDGEYEDYLYELGWLDHRPKPPYPRPGFIGETVYAEEWTDLMQKLDRDGINAPNSMLAGILADLPGRIKQRHAFVCASVMCWLGTACGQSIILNGKRHKESAMAYPYLIAWTTENRRMVGCNGGYRTIEHILAPEDHFGVDILGTRRRSWQMITTIDRYKWLRIDGESYKVAAVEFFGVDFASGPDRTAYSCPVCGITDYPCNCLKAEWKRQRDSASDGGDEHGR